MFCDLVDPELKGLIENTAPMEDLNGKDAEKFGWYSREMQEKLRKMMKNKVRRMLNIAEGITSVQEAQSGGSQAVAEEEEEEEDEDEVDDDDAFEVMHRFCFVSSVNNILFLLWPLTRNCVYSGGRGSYRGNR